MSLEALRHACQPLPDTGYDVAAIARQLEPAELVALRRLDVEGELDDCGRALIALVSVGLAIAADPPRLSLLGDRVCRHLDEVRAVELAPMPVGRQLWAYFELVGPAPETALTPLFMSGPRAVSVAGDVRVGSAVGKSQPGRSGSPRIVQGKPPVILVNVECDGFELVTGADGGVFFRVSP